MTHDEFIKLLEERGDTVYIVDRGLIRFGKFAVTLLATIGIIGFFFVGMDIKKALDEIKEARFETKKASVDLKEAQLETKNASKELAEALSETKKIVLELGDARREAGDGRKELDEAIFCSRTNERISGSKQRVRKTDAGI